MKFPASKLMMALLFVAVLGASIIVIGVAGGATASDDLASENITVTNDTQTIWVEVDGNASIETADNVSVVDVTLSANGTQIDNASINVSEGNSTTFEYDLLDSDRDHDQILVEAVGESDHVDDVRVGVDVRTSGSAFIVEQNVGLVVAMLVLIGGALIFWED